MDRYKNCTIKVNKELVKRRIQYLYGTLNNYCFHARITRMRLWTILNKPHNSKEAECLQTLASLLNISVDEILEKEN